MARIVSASIYLEASQIGMQLAETCGRTCDSKIVRSSLFKRWMDTAATAQTSVSAQLIFEACSFLAVALAFVGVWPLCMHINRKARVFLDHTLRRVGAAAASAQPPKFQTPPGGILQVHSSSSSTTESKSKLRKIRDVLDSALRSVSAQRRRIVAWSLAIVVTFFPRCVLSVLDAYSSIGNGKNSACNQCESCQRDSLLIQTWIGLIPEVPIFIVAFSEPIALSCSLWCMMSERDCDILRQGKEPPQDVESAAVGLIAAGMHIDLPVSHAPPSTSACNSSAQLHEWKPMTHSDSGESS